MTSLRSSDLSSTCRDCVSSVFSGTSSNARFQSSSVGSRGLTPEYAFARLAKGKALVVLVVMNLIQKSIVWIQSRSKE